MTLARTHSIALTGTRGHLVEVEADLSDGLPSTVLIGLPDTALRESRDRVRAAILNSGQDWLQRKITVGLSPARLPQRTCGLDLAIAIAVLAADGVIPVTALYGMVFVSELGLDGRLRPMPDVLPAIGTAGADTMTAIVVAAENKAETTLMPGVGVIGADSLAQVIGWLRREPLPIETEHPGSREGWSAS